MKKEVFMLCLVVCLLFAVSSVCAGDVNDTAIASDDADQVIEEVSDNETVFESDEINGEVISSENEDILNAKDDGKFSTLQNKINKATSGSTIYFENDYKYDEGFDYGGITISQPLTINGKGYTIDGDNLARIFNVANSNVVFKNIIFVNGDTNGDGGAINGDCTAINCTFNSNRVSGSGGAINGDCTAIDCTFNSNRASDFGGAINGECTAIDCTFNSNAVINSGGAINGDCTAIDCIFISNSAYNNNGGAMSGGFAVGCTFNANSAGYVGGAMYDCSAENCTFNSNTARSGGAMSDCDAENCTFNSNSASSWYGGAMFCCYAFNCTFINNSAPIGGGAIDGSSAENCIFIDNSANNGGAIHSSSAWECIFKNNHANENGGAMYGDTQTATDCQFIDNTAKNGGATYQVTAYNCYFTKNNATEYGGAMYEGSSEGCIFKDNEAGIDGDYTYDTDFPKSSLTVFDFISTYNSGDKLIFEFTTSSDIPIKNAIITIRVYKDTLIGTYYALSGEGWIVNLDVGSYIAVCSVENQGYDVDSADAILTIFKADSNLTVNDMEFDYGSSGTTTISYTGATGVVADVVNQPKAVVHVAGNTITVAGLDVGTYKLFVTTIPDDNHNAVIKIVTITVNKASRNPNPTKTTLTLKKVTVKKSAKKLVISATLKINGKAAKGKIIKFKFNGKTYKAKTNNKGVAKITIKKAVLKKLKAGKKITYQASYDKTTKKVTIKVKK